MLQKVNKSIMLSPTKKPIAMTGFNVPVEILFERRCTDKKNLNTPYRTLSTYKQNLMSTAAEALLSCRGLQCLHFRMICNNNKNLAMLTICNQAHETECISGRLTTEWSCFWYIQRGND